MVRCRMLSNVQSVTRERRDSVWKVLPFGIGSSAMKIRTVSLLLTLVGCTSVDLEHKASDWPEHMMTVEHKVSFGEVVDRCYKYLPLGLKLLGGLPFACAEWDLKTQECHIWYFAEFALDHEREHCQGFVF